MHVPEIHRAIRLFPLGIGETYSKMRSVSECFEVLRVPKLVTVRCHGTSNQRGQRFSTLETGK